MVQRTPNLTLPYVQGSDTVRTYPTSSEELAKRLDGGNGTVLTFLTSAARTAAALTPAVGALTFVRDVERYERWDGVRWAPVAGQMPVCRASFAASYTGLVSGWSNLSLSTLTGESAYYAISGAGVQVKVPGVYRVRCSMSVSNASVLTKAVAAYSINSTQVGDVTDWLADNGGAVAVIADGWRDVGLRTNDIVRLWAYLTPGASTADPRTFLGLEYRYPLTTLT